MLVAIVVASASVPLIAPATIPPPVDTVNVFEGVRVVKSVFWVVTVAVDPTNL